MNGETKRTLPWLPLCAVGLIVLTVSAAALAASGDTVADRILGQRRFFTSVPYFVDGRVFGASDVAVDRSVVPNRVYVADSGLNRVLGWSDLERFRADESADLVLGQGTFWSGSLIQREQDCPGVPLATTFCVPTRLAVDPEGNLYVVDAWNFRVLEFDNPFTTDKRADRVFGQPDFMTRTRPRPLRANAEVAVDAAGNVWIVDPAGLGRVLGFDAPPTHDTLPDRIIDTVAGCTATPFFCAASTIEVSPSGDLYVGTQLDGQRVFRQPLTTDLAADFTLNVFGHVAFDAAGNLYAVVDRQLRRYPAPVGAASAFEVVSAVPVELGEAHLALDSGGNLFASFFFGQGAADNSTWVFDAPLPSTPSPSTPSKIGRLRFTNRGLRYPNAVAIDRSSSPNHLFVADGTNRVLGWRDAAGFASGAPADLVLNSGGFNIEDDGADCRGNGLCLPVNFYPGGLAVDSHGNLWVGDFFHQRVLAFERPFDTDGVADRVLGQGGSLTSKTCNRGGRGARSLCYPGALAFDGDDNLYVADLANNRVLLFKDPLHGDDAADRVFGQAGFQQGECNQGRRGPSASTLCLGTFDNLNPNPYFAGAAGLATDAQGSLYVTDSLNARVLIFLDPLGSDTMADRVLGQNGRFNTALRGTGARRFGPFNGGPFGPTGLAVGLGGKLFVADTGNDRLLEFEHPLASDIPSRVFGHPDFNAPGTNLNYDQTPAATATNLFRPLGLAVDDLGNLYVADSYYNRVLAFDRP
jgi:DNA-binding beta-propeller fold protein YncE